MNPDNVEDYKESNIQRIRIIMDKFKQPYFDILGMPVAHVDKIIDLQIKADKEKLSILNKSLGKNPDETFDFT